MRLIRKHDGCDDGTCPAIYDTDDPGLIAVQGLVLQDNQALADLGDIPRNESVVVLPRSLLESFAKKRA